MKYDVCFATDKFFANYLLVCIKSLIDNLHLQNNCSEREELNIYILVDSSVVIEDYQKQLDKVVASCANHNVAITTNQILVDQSSFGNVDFGSCHLRISTLYRLAIDRLLPDSISKLLYLDVDMLICDDVRLLFKEDMSQSLIAAVNDHGFAQFIADSDGIVHLSPLKEGLPELTFSLEHYFNAGLLLINLDKWRDFNISQKSLDMVRNYKLPLYDQDVLNFLSQGLVKELHSKWNFTSYQFYRIYNTDTKLYDYYQKNGQIAKLMFSEPSAEFEEAFNSPSIVHFVSSLKPWQVANANNLNYIDFYPLTPKHQYYLEQWGRVSQTLNKILGVELFHNFAVADSNLTYILIREQNKKIEELTRRLKRVRHNSRISLILLSVVTSVLSILSIFEWIHILD